MQVTEKQAEQIKIIQDYMKANPKAFRTEIKTKCGVSAFSIEKLQKLGLIKLPAPLSNSMAASYGRKKRGVKRPIVLTGTLSNKKKSPPTFLPNVDYR